MSANCLFSPACGGVWGMEGRACECSAAGVQNGLLRSAAAAGGWEARQALRSHTPPLRPALPTLEPRRVSPLVRPDCRKEGGQMAR